MQKFIQIYLSRQRHAIELQSILTHLQTKLMLTLSNFQNSPHNDHVLLSILPHVLLGLSMTVLSFGTPAISLQLVILCLKYHPNVSLFNVIFTTLLVFFGGLNLKFTITCSTLPSS